MGFSAPAFAASSYNFSVYLTTPAGAPVTGAGVIAVQLQLGEEAPNDPEPEAIPVPGEPGHYVFSGTDQLLSGPTYTLAFDATGSATATSYSELLGGVSLFDQAETFTVGTAPGEITSSARASLTPP